MKPILGLVLLIALAYGTLTLVGIVMSILFASSLLQMLLFGAIGSIVFGALLLSSGRNKAEDVYERAYVTGGGTRGDVRVWPRLQSEPSVEGEDFATPSGVRSRERIEKAAPRGWTTVTVGLALLVAGVAMMASVYLLGFD